MLSKTKQQYIFKGFENISKTFWQYLLCKIFVRQKGGKALLTLGYLLRFLNMIFVLQKNAHVRNFWRSIAA